MNSLIRTSASAAWLVLTGFTVVSWALGTRAHWAGDAHVLPSLLIFAIAIFKIRLVGLYFMELRAAPLYMRSIFEGYCVVLLGLLVGTYLLG